MKHKQITTCLWFDDQAHDAAKFYTELFKGEIKDINYYTTDTPSEKEVGSILSVNFNILNQDFMGLNGGPEFHFSESVSFVVECDDQAEIDYYWSKLSSVEEAEACGWCKDQFGISWQIIPANLSELLDHQNPLKSEEAMKLLLTMKKIEIEPFLFLK